MRITIILSMSNSRHCLISLYKTILCCGFCNLMCALSYTRAYYNKKRSYVNLGFANRLSTRFNYIYSFRARALKRKKKMIGIVNLRYASDILLKLAGSFNFINTDYKITTNTIILRMGSHYRIFYFAVNIL